MEVDVCVALRVYPGISKQPFINTNNKLDIVKASLGSLIQCLGSLSFHIIIILDGCNESYEKLVSELVKDDNLTVVNTAGIGNAKTFEMQHQLLMNQKFSRNIFFAEDDYFYTKNTFRLLLQLINNKIADFVTPHDHLHYYHNPLHKGFAYREFNNANTATYKFVASTCMTFLTTKVTLQKTWPIFSTYFSNNYDFTIWLALTQKNIFEKSTLFENFKSSFYWRSVAKLFKYSFSQYFFGTNYKLAVVVPAVGTHMQKDELGPNVEWESLFNIFENEFINPIRRQGG